MKILRVIGGLEPKFGGPSFSATKSIYASLRNHNNHIDLAVPTNNIDNGLSQLINELTKKGVTVHTANLTPFFGGSARKYGISIPLLKWIKMNIHEYDVIHCHSAWVVPTVYSIFKAYCNNIPVVLTPHESLTSFDSQSAGNYLTRFIKRILKKIIVKWVSAIIFSSDLESKDTLDVPDSKRTIVYHPVAEKSISRPAKKLENCAKDQINIGYLGRLHPKKNIELLIKALLKLPENYQLLIAGCGDSEYEASLRKIVQVNKLSKRVKWLGWVNGEEKVAFFDNLTLLGMPSEYECFGNSGAEAMCYGVPVVVTENTGIASVVEKYKAGVVVLTNIAGVVSGIRTIVNDKNGYAEMSSNAMCASNDCFTFSAHERAVSKIYEDLF